MPKLGRHQIVENRIDGRVEVEHNAARVQNAVIVVQFHAHQVIAGRQNYPQDEDAERQQAQEEGHHHRDQHGDHLFSGSRVERALRAVGARVRHQVSGDYEVHENKQYERTQVEHRIDD